MNRLLLKPKEKIVMKLRNLLLVFTVVAMILVAACAPVAAPSGDGGEMAAGGPCSEVTVGENDGMPDLQGCTLRIAVENAYQPFNYIDTDSGEAVGYDYDIFNEICSRINCVPEFEETSWDAMVAIMGGHGLTRDDPTYVEVARLGRALTEAGYYLATGGGPGAMEAANLGAWMAEYDDAQLDDALEVLAGAGVFDPVGEWLDAGFEVRRRWPCGRATSSLGVPTWHYGHEPPNVDSNPSGTFLARLAAVELACTEHVCELSLQLLVANHFSKRCKPVRPWA